MRKPAICLLVVATALLAIFLVGCSDDPAPDTNQIPVPTPTPSQNPMPTATPAQTATPTAVPTSIPATTPTQVPTATATSAPTATVTPTPTQTPMPAPTPTPPELTVDRPTVSESATTAGQAITLEVTVRNRGIGESEPTTLRFYRSTDSTVTSEDTEVGSVPVPGLSTSTSSGASLVTDAPSAPGTYYYGACVDPVSRESDTANNCSEVVALTVHLPPDMAADPPTASDDRPMTGQTLTLRVTVRNLGDLASGPVTLTWYRSDDATVTIQDAEVGADHAPTLAPSGISAESILTHAPSTPGTYHYGVCVVPAPGESQTANNCSSPVTVTVAKFQTENLPWVADGLTGNESRAMDHIQALARIDHAMSQRVAGSLWLLDGVTDDELRVMDDLRSQADTRRDLAALVTTVPDQTGHLTQDTLLSLRTILSKYPSGAERLLDQPWVRDGLTAEEAALIVTLRDRWLSEVAFEDLVQGGGRVWSETVALPLAGEVDIFVVKRSEYWVQDALDVTAVTAELFEGFMGISWPKSDTIIAILDRDSDSDWSARGWNSGTHVVLRSAPGVLVHELAHFYFGTTVLDRIPFWLSEGGADFLEKYFFISINVGDFSSYGVYLRAKNKISTVCPPQVTNIYGWLAAERTDKDGFSFCPYTLGNHFLAGLHHSLGHEVIVSALQDLHQGRGTARVTEDEIYKAFLKNTPTAQQEDFRFLYSCLHGRPIPGYAPPLEASPPSEVSALAALYSTTNGPGWTNSENWLSDAPLGQWHGVSTDCNGSVVGLDLNQNQLAGPIPTELGSLSNLTKLSLGGNQLTGPIPAELGSLSNLTELSLWRNQLTGYIPRELANLSNLSDMLLGDNRLSGPIPAQLANLSSLVILELNNNRLNGPIPRQLADLSNLAWLSLRGNHLSGPIPRELENLSKLTRLWLSGNQFSGCVPHGLEAVETNDLDRLGLEVCEDS